MQTNALEMILNHLGDTAVYVIRQDNQEILYFNEKTRRVTPEIRLGMKCFDVWPDSCTNCPLTGIGDKESNSAINYNDPFGHIVEQRATKMEWGEEQLPAYVITVTPHRQAAELLNLETAVSQVFDEMIFMDLTEDRVLTARSGGYYRMQPQEGKCSYENALEATLHPSDREVFRKNYSASALLKAFAKNRTSVLRELRRLGEDGQYHWIMLRAVPMGINEAGHRTGLLLVSTIDEKKIMEQESKALASGIIALFGELMITNLKTGRFSVYKSDGLTDDLWVSDDFKSQNELYGETLIHTEDREEFFRYFSPDNLKKQVAEGKRQIRTELRRKMRDGSFHWVEMIGVLRENETGDGHIALLTYRDISELKEAQEVLRRALTMAEKANMAKSDFLSRISHDIRTPLNAIIGMAHLAKMNLEQPQKAEECLDKLHISAKFLLALINDVLDMSKIESGKMNLVRETFRFSEFVTEVTEICREQAWQKKQEFTAEIAPELDSCYIGDSLRLNQIMINLLSNAVKYTPDRGKISLKISLDMRSQEEDVLIFEVRDDGIGISEEFQQKLFEPFEQENADGGSMFGGSGLGLPIAGNLVRMMNGSISVESSPGKGSCFRVRTALGRVNPSAKKEPELQTGREKTETTEASAAEQEPGGKLSQGRPAQFNGEPVLLVEDNDFNLEIAKMLLNECALSAETARNGIEAVERFEASGVGYYRAILMDIRMPEMDGLEATLQIRAKKRPDAGTVPIIAMTANAFHDEEKQAMDAGMNYYLTKPIEPELLFAALQKCIRS